MDNQEKEYCESTPLNRPSEADHVTPNYYPPPTYIPQPSQPPPGYYHHPGQGYYPHPAPSQTIPNSDHQNPRNDNRDTENIPGRTKQLYCPNCHRYGWSKVSHKIGLANHLCCGYLCLVGCWLCCWIPYFSDDCKDSDHFCGFCNTLIKSESPL